MRGLRGSLTKLRYHLAAASVMRRRVAIPRDAPVVDPLSLSVPPSVLSPRARTIAVLAVTQLIGWGTTFEMPAVLGRIIARDIGVDNEIAFAGLTVMMLVSALLGPTVGDWLERYGAAKILAAGSLVFVVGLVVMAFAVGPLSYLGAWAIVGFGGALGLSTAAYTAVVEREGHGSRRTIGIVMIVTGLSAGVFWPVLSALEAAFGWRDTCLIGAAINLIVVLPLYLFALPPPGDRRARARTEEAAQALPVLTGRERITVFAVIAAVATVSSFVTFGLAPSLLAMFERAGAPSTLALQLGAARSVIGITARFGDAVIGARGSTLTTATVGIALILASFPLIALADGSVPMLIGFILLYGVGTGITTVARAVLPLSFFSAMEYGRQASRLSLPQNLANAAAPVAVTAMLDRGGLGFTVACLALFASAALAGVLWLARVARQRSRTT